MTQRRISTPFVALLVIASLLFGAVLLPYYGAVLWSVILAIVFHPLYLRLLEWTRGRAAISSLLTLLSCICIVVIPALILGSLLAQEATKAYQLLSSQDTPLADRLIQIQHVLPQSLQNFLERLDLPAPSEVAQRFSSFLQSVLQVMAKGFYSFGQSAIGFTIAAGVAMYVLFFLFKDGARLVNMLRRASPLKQRETETLLETFAATVAATVKGTVIIAVIQGMIGGITFQFLGINGALLWGVVMAVLSLVPAVGAGLIWAPVAVFLLLSGSVWKGIILLIIGVGVISMVDNLLRPRLVGRYTNMPDYVVLVSTLGGLAAFGVNGFVLGPVFAALFIAAWKLYVQERAKAPEPADPAP